jgi:hypothetical protein
MTGGNRSHQSSAVPGTASRRYDNMGGKSNLATVLSVKLTEVLYVPRAWHWFSILRSQADASRAAYSGYPEGSFPAGGKLVHALSVKDPPEHQIIHLELPATHEPLTIALERLPLACIFNSRLPPSLVD